MRPVYADTILINGEDSILAKRDIIGEEVKRMGIKMLVDTGAYMMAINDTIQSQIELPFVERRKVQLTNSKVVEYDVVGPTEVRFTNQRATCNAFVLSGDSEPLPDAIPMEEMDVLVHPQRLQLVVNSEHPNYAVLKMK